ncbi:MAG: leucine-rich repeat protein, partial [Muribaculaceae bacterium]|nr:leucine-rich repeat protein [Muribaculaceae bacterium]
LNHNNLTGTLSLPSTLKSIGFDAFRECDFTGSLILPDGLEHIEGGAFCGCNHFVGDLHIPNSIIELGEGALAGMTGLTGRIVLPEKLTEISGSLFSNTNVTSIEWPKNLQVISGDAFSGVDFKGIVTLPQSVIKLGERCFYNSGIRKINLPNDLTVIPAFSFWNCQNLTDTLNLPSNVELIGSNAYEGCDHLEAIVLPASLKRIDSYAFENCFSLNYIRCDATEPPSIEENVFWGVQKDNFTLEVPEQSVDAYKNAPGWCEFKRISAYRNFVARPSKYNVLNKGGVKEIILNADTEWELAECPSWCHLDKTTGSKKTLITLTVDPMAKGSEHRNGTVIFRLKGMEGYQTNINVTQYDYSYDEDQSIVLQSATKGRGINLIFIGDGYDAEDISDGSYLRDMNQEMEYLFGIEPYTTYREYFNVYTAFALSEDSGVEALNTWRNTKFHVSLGDGCKRLTADYVKALDYCAEVVPQTIQGDYPRIGCILVSNTDIYEGVTYTGDSFCAVVTKSSDVYPYDARGIVQHEAGGHGIGWLGDEYVYHFENIRKCGCMCCDHVFGLNNDHSIGFARNLSLIGTHKDVPWSHLVFHPSYGDIVDVYEGGYFHSRGVYRSELNSCMNNNIPYYSTWSRQLIVERIMNLSGEKFDIESFYAKDSRETGSRFTGTTRGHAISSGIRQSQPPVRITGYTYGKKGGNR